MAQYVYGKSVVYSLLKNKGDIVELYMLADRNSQDEIISMAKASKIPVQIVTRKAMDNMVNGNHQGYIAKIKDYKMYEIEDILESIPKGKQPLLVALDGLEDPHNLGAIMRTCSCVGADGIIIEKNRSVSLNSTVAKVSVGAIDVVKVASVTNLSQTLDKLKKEGYWVVGTDMSDTDYRLVDYNMPLVVVIGSEGKGMHRLVKEKCDITVTIPMEGEIGSLNASVAAGVMLYQVYSNRFPAKK